MANLEVLVAQCDSTYRHAPSTDTCVYTGTAGIALLHLHLATTLYADNQTKSHAHLQLAHSLLTPTLSHLSSRDVTFLCGAGGPLAIMAVLEAALGRPAKARVRVPAPTAGWYRHGIHTLSACVIFVRAGSH